MIQPHKYNTRFNLKYLKLPGIYLYICSTKFRKHESNTFIVLFLLKLSILSFLFLSLSEAECQSWRSVSNGISIDSSKEIEEPIKTFCVYNGKLYIGGHFANPHKKYLKNIASWDGKKIDTVGAGIDGSVWSLTQTGNYLCIGGQFHKKTFNFGSSDGIVLWNDTTGIYTAMDDAFGIWNPDLSHDWIIYALCNFGNILYAGGCFIYKSDELCIAKWSDNSWSRVGKILVNQTLWSGRGGLIGCVVGLTTYKGHLYACGKFQVAVPDYIHFVARLDGDKWDAVGHANFPPDYDFSISSGINDGAFELCEYKECLFAAGRFDSIDGIRCRNIAQWNNIVWSTVGNGVNGIINALVVYNDKLYAGGQFDSAGGKPAKNIAVWDGFHWGPVGQGLEFSSNNKLFKGRVVALEVYNNELYAGGIFNVSGKTKLNNFAKICISNDIENKK